MFLQNFLIPAIIWSFGLLIFSILGALISQKFFKSLEDFGYPFYKIIGIAVIGYIVWLLGSFKIAPFSFLTIIAVILSLVGFFLFKNCRLEFKKIFIFEEILFLTCFLGYLLLRSTAPDIHGLEKFMDLALVNANLKTDFFPPIDPWLSNMPINYYYFGHYLTAVLTKFTDINSSISYNLMLGTIFALVFTQSFSILYNWTKKIRFGILAGLLITMAGNLHTIYAFTKGYGIGENMIKPPWELLWGTSFNNYWYPMAVRIAPYTINEFPAYSFTVGDLHAHFINLPIILLMCLLIFVFVKTHQIRLISLIGLIGSINYMTNSLDFPIWIGVLFFFAPAAAVLSATIGLILSTPFIRHFEPFIFGVGLNCLPPFGPFLSSTDRCQITQPYMWLIMWGFPLIMLLLFWKFRQNVFVDNFVAKIAILGLLLTVVPEILYFRDIYPLHFRANTVFKLGYQAFVILGLASTYFIFKIRTKNIFYFLFVSACLTVMLIYPYFSIKGYYSYPLTIKQQYLAGFEFLNQTDKLAINFLNNLPNRPTILEAVGDSYSEYARISTFTGLPTILGWPGHEWGWHKGPEITTYRISDVKTIYETNNWQEAKRLLDKYGVKYVVIGQMEKDKYSKLDEGKFLQNLKRVFAQTNLNIYQNFE